jgi:hypothetical protein
MDDMKIIDIDWRKILKRVIRREMRTVIIGSGDGQVAVSCQCFNGYSISINCWKFLD